ncbi:MAG: DUF262 domain-containing protein [Gammaproteobacteria bacterium]|nr:DUF262 domain-containing protein [Gammaproteobacteria bacterium]
MIEYRVRSISLLNLVNDVKAGRLIPDAYFQRNLVWREVHKRDFIKTILLGYPFPQIFISKGKVDVKEMSTISCIVDGQQRTNAILEFIDDRFDVDGEAYSDLPEDKKSDFLKYEVPVIELDLENNDAKVQEIFQRINRTSNSLTAVEKLASQYGASEYMLVAKLLSEQIDLEKTDNDDFREDPNIPDEFFEWAKRKDIGKFVHLITKKGVFSSREMAKKTHLMHVLNMISSFIGGFYNRNEKANEYLDDYALEFGQKDEVVRVFEAVADYILKVRLKSKSYWYNKANLFSLIVSMSLFVSQGKTFNVSSLKCHLENFENDIPDDYRLAAAEGVNSTSSRQLRNRYVTDILNKCIASG